MGIPLPALAVRSPEEIDPLAMSQQSQQIRNLMGVNQLQPGLMQQQQQEIKLNDQKLKAGEMDMQDRQAGTTAFRDWDGKDPNDLVHAVIKNGGSANGAYAMQQHILEVRKTAAETAAKDAETGSKNADTATKLHDRIAGSIESIIGAPDEQKQTLWAAEVAKEEKAGTIQPGTVSTTYPGDDQAKVMANSHKLSSQLAKETIEQQKADQEAWKPIAGTGTLVNVNTGESKTGPGGASMTPAMMEAKYVTLGQKQAQGQPLTAEETAFRKSYAQMKELVPAFSIRMQATGGGMGPGAGGGGGTPGAGGGNATPTIDQVPLNIRNQVKAVIEKRSPMPPQGRNNPVNTAVRQWVNTLEPEYDETTFPAKNKILTEYVKDASTGEIGAINTALGHLGELNVAAKALSQNDLPLLHSLASKLGLATGGDAESTYQSILHRVGPEMTKAYVKGGGTEGERGANEADFALSKGQKQIISNIAESASLLNSKLASKRNDWNKTFQPRNESQQFDARFITPDAKQTLDSLSAKAPTSKAEAKGSALSIKAPNGKTYTFKDQASLDKFKKDANIQ